MARTILPWSWTRCQQRRIPSLCRTSAQPSSPQLAVVVPRAHAADDCQLGGAVLARSDALRLRHQQAAVALQLGSMERALLTIRWPGGGMPNTLPPSQLSTSCSPAALGSLVYRASLCHMCCEHAPRQPARVAAAPPLTHDRASQRRLPSTRPVLAWCWNLLESRACTATAVPYTCSSRTTDTAPRSAGCRSPSAPDTLRRRSRPTRMSCGWCVGVQCVPCAGLQATLRRASGGQRRRAQLCVRAGLAAGLCEPAGTCAERSCPVVRPLLPHLAGVSILQKRLPAAVGRVVPPDELHFGGTHLQRRGVWWG